MEIIKILLVFLVTVIFSVPLSKRLGLGSVLGYLLGGFIIGPQALALVVDVENVFHLSELGVIFLLFIIGLEVEPKKLWALKKSVFLYGSLHMLACGTVLSLVIYQMFSPLPPAIAAIIGLSLALSSTAFVMQFLGERNDLATPHGKQSFSILLFQDLAAIPLLTMIPFLKGQAFEANTWSILGKFLLFTVGLLGFGRILLRELLRFISSTKSSELSTAVALTVVVGVAGFVGSLGLSLSLGAFIAGVLLADSEYRHDLEASIAPFKDILLGLFFLAVGMSIDVQVLVEHFATILAAVILMVGLKILCGLLLARFGTKSDYKTGIRVAVLLSQGGEFAFVILKVLSQENLFSAESRDILLIIISASMATTPLLLNIAERCMQLRFFKRYEKDLAADIIEEQGSVIICGYGRVGQIITRLLTSQQISCTPIDVNHDQIETARRFGNRAYLGDAAKIDVLKAAKIEQATCIVVAVDDVPTSVKIVEQVRHHFPHIKIVARARNRFHCFQLWERGVTVLQRETLLSTLDLAVQTLAIMGIDRAKAESIAVRFKAYDEVMLKQQFNVRHDEKTLIQTSKAAAVELQRILQMDAENIR